MRADDSHARAAHGVPYSALALPTPVPEHAPDAERYPEAVLPWRLNPVAWLLLGGIALYRHVVPARWKRRCIYSPTCSAYALGALKRHGAVHGTRRAWHRLRRCNGAMFRGGQDPV